MKLIYRNPVPPKSLLLALILFIGILIIISLIVKVKSPPLRIIEDRYPDKVCFFLSSTLKCSANFTFVPAAHTFEFTISNYGEQDVVIPKISLRQIVPYERDFCWLNVSKLPNQSASRENNALLSKANTKTFVILDCIDFNATDVLKGVWSFNTSAYEIRGGQLIKLEQSPVGNLVTIRYRRSSNHTWEGW